jgi:hypothetical protein
VNETKQITLQPFIKEPRKKKRKRIFSCPICGTKRYRHDMRKLTFRMSWENTWHRRLVCIRCYTLAIKEENKNKRRRKNKRKNYFVEPKTKQKVYFEPIKKPPKGACPICGLANTSLTCLGICFECYKQQEAERKRKEELKKYIVHE